MVLTSDTFFLGFAIARGAVDADVEDRATPEGWENELLDEGFDEGLRRALGHGVRIFLQDGLEGCSRALADMQHVDGR